MTNIHIISSEIDVSGIIKEINDQSENWLLNTSRQRFTREQVNTENIILVEGYSTDPNVKDTRNSHSYRRTVMYDKYPETIKILKRYFPKGLSRILIVKLKAGKKVLPHDDDGMYYKLRHRYHIVVTGSYLYTVGDESQQVHPGTLFWFDNKKVHSAFNNTSEDRISIIFDVEPQLNA